MLPSAFETQQNKCSPQLRLNCSCLFIVFPSVRAAKLLTVSGGARRPALHLGPLLGAAPPVSGGRMLQSDRKQLCFNLAASLPVGTAGVTIAGGDKTLTATLSARAPPPTRPNVDRWRQLRRTSEPRRSRRSARRFA